MVRYTQENFQKAFDVSDEVFDKIKIYHALLLKWQRAINLVSPKTIDESWHRHFADSAQVTSFVPEVVKSYADLGCGGGFPGLVVAMMRPEIDVHLVESDERKCQFMRAVIREAGVQNVTVHTKRIEQVVGDFTPDFVSARALASLEKLLGYCMPWAEANDNLSLCFMKGERAREELAETSKKYDLEHSSFKSITDEKANILLIKKLRFRA